MALVFKQYDGENPDKSSLHRGSFYLFLRLYFLQSSLLPWNTMVSSIVSMT
jgi:hypothetical protein